VSAPPLGRDAATSRGRLLERQHRRIEEHPRISVLAPIDAGALAFGCNDGELLAQLEVVQPPAERVEASRALGQWDGLASVGSVS
jgi:hypothetical protein